MKRAVTVLFHLSGTGFVLSTGLWGYIRYVQRAVPFHPLEPAWAIRVLSTLVVVSTVLSILATLLSAASGFRSFRRKPERA